MSVNVVIGANYGDEGKGMVVNQLARHFRKRASVVRFNGGAQAGHTVELPTGHRHVFSHVGAGALSGSNTILSEFFIINPLMYRRESLELSAIYNDLDMQYPQIYVSGKCRVTFPIDVFINRELERSRGEDRHGSCGVGINETVTRYLAGYGKTIGELSVMTVQEIDLYMKHVCEEYAIPRLVEMGYNDDVDLAIRVQHECNDRRYMEALSSFMWDDLDVIIVDEDHEGLYDTPNLIFEGAQGLLLDEHTGQFPYVTRSNTGLTNVVDLAPEGEVLNVWYVTRAYLTRHGAGPLVGEDPSIGSQVTDLTNKPNDWQGSLRFAPLDPYNVLANIVRDVSACPRPVVVNVVVTCCDQVDPSTVARLNSVFNDNELVNTVWNCSDPTGKTLKLVG